MTLSRRKLLGFLAATPVAVAVGPSLGNVIVMSQAITPTAAANLPEIEGGMFWGLSDLLAEARADITRMGEIEYRHWKLYEALVGATDV